MVDVSKIRRPPTVLDEAKRMKIVALLSNGSSRRTAACMVGCAPSTITYTAAHDQQFAEEIARAERNVEIEALRAIRAAMRQERYWRAAAWVLKRRNPDDFGPRQPKVFSQTEMCQVLSKVAEMLVGEAARGKLPQDHPVARRGDAGPPRRNRRHQRCPGGHGPTARQPGTVPIFVRRKWDCPLHGGQRTAEGGGRRTRRRTTGDRPNFRPTKMGLPPSVRTPHSRRRKTKCRLRLRTRPALRKANGG